MEQACRAFWQVSRSAEPVASNTMALRRRALVECYYNYYNNNNENNEDGGREEGVLDSLLHCGLSRTEAADNAVNAMIAAVDAVQALLFWTIWNLTKTKTGWRTCQEQVMQTTTNDHDDDAREQEQFQNDLDGLAKIKQTATRGERVDYSNLTYLGRALCETLRVFPPVWTLPRTWPNTGDSHLIPDDAAAVSVPMNNDGRPAPPIRFSKFDIPTANGTKSYRDWNPNGLIATTPHSTYMTSFGLGRRHCPAGTAAIFAVYYFLTEIFQIIEELEESQENHALDSARLLPTLSVVGPQWFRVVYHDPKK
jgi:cytochrome P450